MQSDLGRGKEIAEVVGNIRVAAAGAYVFSVKSFRSPGRWQDFQDSFIIPER